MNIKKIIREEMGDFDWIENTTPNEVTISDLEVGDEITLNCPWSLIQRKYLVNLYKKTWVVTDKFTWTDENDTIHIKLKKPWVGRTSLCKNDGCTFSMVN